MNIAKEYGVDVDLHLHDRGQVGFYTMDKWLGTWLRSRNLKEEPPSVMHFGLSELPSS